MRFHLPSPFAAVLLCGAVAALPARGEGLASSAASTASSAVGSLSNSITQSSNSSSKTNVAEGDYRILERAVVAQQPGTVRLRLEPVKAGNGEGFDLLVPEPVAEAARLASGGVVTARQRPYGVEFAQGEPRQAFFLVLADAWYRELQTTPVTL